jgi:hypothetical protein
LIRLVTQVIVAELAMPAFTDAYRTLLAQLETQGIDVETVFATLDTLRRGLIETVGTLDRRTARSA